MPRFSVIIPVHNRPALVRQTIDSVLAQTFADREIIVVDDASTDDTPSVLRTYGGGIRVITLLEQSGCEVARNAGAAVARGDYLAFLDSDDLLFRWALDTYDFVLARTGQPALLVSRLVVFSGEPSVPQPGATSDAIEIIVFQDYLSRDRNIRPSASMIVVRRDVYGSAGGWRQSTASTFYGSDHDFLLRVGCHGPAVLLERPPAVAYRVHPGNSVRNIRRVVDGILRLIAAERRGSYPGGWKRSLDRRAAIGYDALWWGRRALRCGLRWLGAKLILAGFDMIMIRFLRRWQIAFRGLTPLTTLQRNEPAATARPVR
jgi:glycosyltransferase involved in cell wall biosynthesis